MHLCMMGGDGGWQEEGPGVPVHRGLRVCESEAERKGPAIQDLEEFM